MRLFLLSIFIIILNVSFPQTTSEQKLKDTRHTVYWIKLYLYYRKDPKLKAYRYEVSYMSNRLYVGSLDQFSQELWKARSNGSYIIIGPFTFREQAKLALKVYSKTNRPALENDTTHYFWYLVKIKYYQRLNSYKLEHIPAAIGEGTLKDFFANYDAAKYNQAIVIGPFATRLEAELSKRIYRQEE